MRYKMISSLRTMIRLCGMFLLLSCFVPLAAQAQGAGATIYGEVKAGKLEPSVEIRVISTTTKKRVAKVNSEKGRYRISGIAAGKYRIVAHDGDDFLPGEHKGQELSDGDEKQFHFDLQRRQRHKTVGGIVRDSKGSPIPDVDVVAILSDFEIERTKTNIAGAYELDIPEASQEYAFVVEGLGTLTVALEAEVNTIQPAFSDFTALRVDLTVKEELGIASTLVSTVSGVEIAQLPLRGIQVTHTYERRKIADLPTNISGYSIDTLALLAPGVVPGFGNVNSNGTTFSVNGSRGRSNNFMVDGADNNDISISGPNYGAPLTRRSGTNSFHGSLSYRAGNDAFDARDPFNLPGFDTYRTHSGSASLGGRIRKDRVFFFLSYGLERGAKAPTFSPLLVSGLSDLNQRLAGLGLPDEDLRRFLTTSSSDSPVARLDFILSDKHSVWADYGYELNRIRKDFPVGPFGTTGTPSSARDISGHYHTLSLNHTWTISSTLVSEANYSYTRHKALITPAEPAQISLLIPGLALLGRATDLVEGDGHRRTTHRVSENLSLSRGKHALRFGGQGEFDETLFRFAAFESGRAILPDLEALSSPQSQARNSQDSAARNIRFGSASRVDLFQIGLGGSQVRFNTSALTAYIQDEFKARPDLTLFFGLRYGADFPPSFQRKETDGLQPRVGLAWDITGDGKTLLRTSYSMLRDRLPQVPIGLELLMGGQGLQADHPQPVRRVLSFVGSGATDAFNQFIAGGAVPAGPQLATIYDDKSRSPITQNVEVTFDRDLGWSTRIDFTYNYRRGDRLLTSTNVNLPVPTPGNGRSDFGNATLNPAFAQIYQFQTIGNSSYHGGTLRVSRRYSNYVALDARYIFSKSIDDVPFLSYFAPVSRLRSVSFEATPENVFDRATERALSEAHPTHRFVISAQGNMPEVKWRDKNVLLRNLGRLSFSGIFNFNSGGYFDVVTGFDANRDGNPLTDRPLGVGRNTFLGQRYARLDSGVKYWYEFREGWRFEVLVDVFNLLNRANFTSFDTVLGRNDLTGLNPDIISGRRGISNFDFRQQLVEGGFGLATRADSPRRILLGLKLSF